MPPPGSPQFSADTMDRMLQAATYGAHMLDHAAASQQPSQPASEPPRPSPKETILEEPVVKESGDVPSPQLSVPAAKRQVSGFYCLSGLQGRVAMMNDVAYRVIPRRVTRRRRKARHA